MSVIEWILLGWLILGAVAALYYIPKSGFDRSPGEILFGVVLNMAWVFVLAAGVAGLTWFGVVMLALFAWNVGSGVVTYIRNPQGTHHSARYCAVDMVFAVIAIVLLLTVGVTI